MILKVLQAPHPALKTRSQPAQPEDPAVQTLIENMLETMVRHPRCVGLAAPQVGEARRVIVVDAGRVDKPGSRHGPLVMLNPSIVQRGAPRLSREGCLSIPDYTGNVLRDEEVSVRGFDRGGKLLEIHAQGFEAIVFQHEVDHLDGKQFLDRVASLETDVFRRKKYS